MNNIASKICAGAMQKLKERGAARSDMALADYQMIDKANANILLAYVKTIPSIQDIAQFVTATFRGKAYPIMETARVYEQQKVVGVTVKAPQITRSLDDAQGMMKVTASTFMDCADNSEWEVRKTDAGVSYLARALSEDFEAIIAAHKASRVTCPIVTASANFNEVTASYLAANEGDTIKFFDGNGLQCGVIKQVMPDGKSVKVMNDEGEVYVINKTSITQIIRKDPEEQQQIDKDMENFYARIFGQRFAADLFKNGSQV